MSISFILILLILFISSEIVQLSNVKNVMVRSIINEFSEIYPDPPYCNNHIKEFNFTFPMPIRMWTLDQSQLYDSGIILWIEKLRTSCYSRFFGDVETKIITRSIESLPLDYSFPDIDKKISMEESIDLENEDAYTCSWLRTLEKTTYRIYVKKIKLFRDMTGRPKLEGNWEKDKKDSFLWRSEFRLLKFNSRVINTCPLMRERQEMAIINIDINTYFITFPQSRMQFSININKLTPTCKIEDDIIYETEGHYFLSWDLSIFSKMSRRYNMANFDDIKGKRPFKEIQLLKLPAEVTYSLNKLVDYTNENLQDIIINLCQNRQLSWSLLSPPFLESKIARFITQNPYANGIYVDNMFKILIPSEPYEQSIEIPEHKNMVNGKLEIQINKTLLYIEPISGIITLDPMRWKTTYLSTWIPLSNSQRYDYFSEKTYKGTSPKNKFSRMERFTGFSEIERMNIGYIRNLDFSEDNITPNHMKENLLRSIWEDWSTEWTSIKVFIILVAVFIIISFVKKLIYILFIRKN